MRKPYLPLAGVSFVILASLAFSSGIDAGVYRCVDKDGRVHFADRPRADCQSETINIRRAPPIQTPAPDASERREKQQRLLRAWEEERKQRQETTAKAKQEKAEQERRCTVARDRLRSYRDAAYLYELDKDGKRKIVSDAEKQRTIQELEEAIKRYCG